MKIRIREKESKPMKPAVVITLSFFAIILIGTFLFMLPFMTRDGKGLPFFTALFTATSGVCVTGLTLVDPVVTFTRYGQILLALLIEVGGISMVTFASFFMFTLKKKSALRSMRLAQEYTNLDELKQVKSLVKVIIATAFICQAAGAAVLSIRFVPQYGAKGLWMAVFTAISAYCNAGFDLFGMDQEFGSLINHNSDYIVMFTIMALIILGGIGFFVFYDIVNFRKTKKLSLHTRIVLVFTAALIVIGFIVFFVYEYNNEATLGKMPLNEKIVAALFQSVTSRTAGYASIDIANMNDISKIFMMFLMLIGAGSGSTAGGIKITTFAVVMISVISAVKNRDDAIIFGKRVDKKTVSKSLAIIVMALVVIFITASVLLMNAPDIGGIDAFFESVSAFATVGLSVGVTSQMGLSGLLALILTMFIGRLGPICFVVALGFNRNGKAALVRPEGRIMVG